MRKFNFWIRIPLNSNWHVFASSNWLSFLLYILGCLFSSILNTTFSFGILKDNEHLHWCDSARFSTLSTKFAPSILNPLLVVSHFESETEHKVVEVYDKRSCLFLIEDSVFVLVIFCKDSSDSINQLLLLLGWFNLWVSHKHGMDCHHLSIFLLFHSCS